MSALTDLFTALATKIRSKTGGSDTYTPPQMVNAIDDVYDAGVAAGTTPTQTKTVTAGTSATTVTPDAGYALSSVTVNPTPSQSKSATPTTSAQTISPDSGKLLSQVSVGAIPSDYVIPTSITPSNTSPVFIEMGSAYKPSASGYAISSYDNVGPSGTPLRYYANEMVRFENAGYIIDNYQNVSPSDLSPTSLTSGNMYKPDAAGYFIGSYSSVSPSSSGTYFSSGMKKMASSGYAYSSQPSLKETPLWTNSNPTSDFGNTTPTPYTVTLSQSYANFNYIKIEYRFSTSVTTSAEVIIPKDVLSRSTSVSTFAIGMNSGSGNTRVRTGYATSNTTIGFLGCYQTTTSSQSVSKAYIIPTKISGLKY